MRPRATPGRRTPTEPIVRLTRASFVEGARELRARDRRLRQWIDRIGPVPLRRQPSQFAALCRAVIAQQVSAAAARAIYRRVRAEFAPARVPSAGGLLDLDAGTLRACGLSQPKVRYLRAIAWEFEHGRLRGRYLGRLPDEDVVAILTSLPGVGIWTAEMFLIFGLGRRDVFSSRDLALRVGVQRVEERSLSAEEVDRVATRWAPYRSIASLYLWRIAHWKE
ncbi:MAG: DNA-3-methyladenine glycosylase 2 family protein [Gammaproteobacteria bacterium]|nr:DNA-3-methyladenine glycosylase 2 family protein [Gammaproteobacteria bacterium]NIR84094.1 DNA-3-methyladenine glycosylase 2 family protein [Gammaproteobacteria bacterium]NIR89238.1 DNA-3-methyladenine glycosylase 2 family protein [Gammaproteobacteria bacterium]NIU05040.1 DNA-3-methyladenine glycosylase 2 family protein [Gammaproteobacteria bacterium]NIV52206.1 DNA-3-methyladenine glycosylase 2 family protein [Gammaproteobacteria bacterium]